MNKCLITKLSGSCGNTDLLRIGEMRVHFAKSDSPTASTQGKTFSFVKDAELEIIGDAYFTDKQLSANLGKKITISANNEDGFFVSNADCDIAILDKYSLAKLKSWAVNQPSYSKNISFNIDNLKYSAALDTINFSSASVMGDIFNLKNLTSLITINLENTQVSGDISNLKNLTSLTTLLLNSTKVSGDISNLKNLTSLTILLLDNTQVSGDISNLKNLTSLTTLKVFNTQIPITGNIGELSTLSKCTYMSLKYSKLTGDLAALPSICAFVSFQNDKGSVFTWGERPSSAKIIAIEGNATVTNIDKMLQNQAQCQIGFSSTSSMANKTIEVAGNRTSASDDAVATLQSKGYTIRIDKA